MSESNNVKFAEDNGKWLWKRYDESGSVIYRSPLFDTERQAREDYEANGGTPVPVAPEAPAAPESTEPAPATSEAPAEGSADQTAGTATGQDEQHVGEANDAGTATL